MVGAWLHTEVTCSERNLERNQIFYLLWLNIGAASAHKKLLLFPPGP